MQDSNQIIPLKLLFLRVAPVAWLSGNRKGALAPLNPRSSRGEGRQSITLALWGSSGLISNQAENISLLSKLFNTNLSILLFKIRSSCIAYFSVSSCSRCLPYSRSCFNRSSWDELEIDGLGVGSAVISVLSKLVGKELTL